MADRNIRSGHWAPPRVKAKNQVAEPVHPGREMSALGPGTADHTVAGAAYRGREVAAARGEPGPAEMGFGTRTGLGYAEPEERSNDYSRAQNEGE